MIAIIGGGASGLMAAVLIKRSVDCEVTVYESMDRVGKKLLATGNGRCNITNIDIKKENYYGDVDLGYNIIEMFDRAKTEEFFASIGVQIIYDSTGRAFPRPLLASSVLDALRSELERLGVSVCCGFEVKSIKKTAGCFKISSRDKTVDAEVVLIAAGGKASPKLGSDGAGYGLLKGLGHSVTAVYPALVQLKTDTELIKPLEGIKVDAVATLFDKNEKIAEQYGEVLFTSYGLSGPPIIQLSTQCALNRNKRLQMAIDFVPEMETDELFAMLKARAKAFSHLTLENFLTGFVHKRVAICALKAAKIVGLSKSVSLLKEQDFADFASALKGLRLNVLDTTGFANAQITAGGAGLCEFDSNLQSKKCQGLFASGEILNINGDCGGYNLQWAWSSASACANGIKQYISK